MGRARSAAAAVFFDLLMTLSPLHYQKISSFQVEHQDLGRTFAGEPQGPLVADPGAVALSELRHPDVDILCDLEAALPPVFGGKEHERPLRGIAIKSLLAVRRFEA